MRKALTKESKEGTVARTGEWNSSVPDNLKDLKDLVSELWSENLSLITEMRKLRYAIAELKYDNATLKAEKSGYKMEGEEK
jgi:regulator of replication initiation timing